MSYTTFSLSTWLARQFDPAYFPVRSITDSIVTESQLPDRYNWDLTSNSSKWQELLHLDIICGGSPLINRAAYAISQFVIASYVNSNVTARHLAPFYDVLRSNIPGTITDVMVDVSLSSAMANYLTFFNKPKGDPALGTKADENYAREVLQLFTIGTELLESDGTVKLVNGEPVPAYTQEDIANLARVFTGAANGGMLQSAYDAKHANTRNPEWDWDTTAYNSNTSQRLDRRLPLHFYPDEHDWGEKQYLGITIPAVTNPGQQTPQAARDEVRLAIAELCKHPNVVPFWVRRLIQRITKENPTPAYMARVVAAGEVGQYRLPDGSVIGSGLRGDLPAILCAIICDEEGYNLDYTDNTAGRIRTPFEMMMAANIYCSGKSARYPASENPPTLRDFIEVDPGSVDKGERISFSNEQPSSRGFFDHPSVFGHGSPDFIDVGSAAGDASLTTPGLQGFNWSEIEQLFGNEEWGGRNSGMLLHSIIRGREIGEGLVALNAAAQADSDAFVDQMNARAFGGLLRPETVAEIKQEAAVRQTPENNSSWDDLRCFGTASHGGPQAGVLGLYGLGMFSTEGIIRR